VSSLFIYDMAALIAHLELLDCFDWESNCCVVHWCWLVGWWMLTCWWCDTLSASKNTDENYIASFKLKFFPNLARVCF